MYPLIFSLVLLHYGYLQCFMSFILKFIFNSDEKNCIEFIVYAIICIGSSRIGMVRYLLSGCAWWYWHSFVCCVGICNILSIYIWRGMKRFFYSVLCTLLLTGFVAACIWLTTIIPPITGIWIGVGLIVMVIFSAFYFEIFDDV